MTALMRGPNVIHPEKPSAVGSRNSLNRGDRDEYLEDALVVDEEVDKMLNHISSKMPPEVLEKLEVHGNIKEKLHNYYNQNMQNMLNRYITTCEDELAKKYRELIDKEESNSLSLYSPREISKILDAVGGVEKFNTGEIEQSIVNICGHLHGAIQRGVYDLEHETNSLLRRKTDVGALVRGENAYAIVKCAFRNNTNKPSTVIDSIVSINVLASELISPIEHADASITKLMASMIADHAHELIENELEKFDLALIDEGKEELDDSERMFERIKSVEKHFSDGKDEDDARYGIIAKHIFDSVEGMPNYVPASERDMSLLNFNVKRIIDDINVKNRGYNTCVNTLTSILDTSRMGYQHIDNLKNARKCTISEYTEKDKSLLPDENYHIELVYYDQEQINALRKHYQQQHTELARKIEELGSVVDKMYAQYKENSDYIDFEDIIKEYEEKAASATGAEQSSSDSDDIDGDEDGEHEGIELTAEEEGAVEEHSGKLWNELLFINPEDTDVEKDNNTYGWLNNYLKKKILDIRRLIAVIYKTRYTDERGILDKRLSMLEGMFNEFAGQINPFQVMPGVLLTVKLSTVRRKLITLNGISNVLNEFLNGISTGFSDAAFAGFSRRRSTVKEDLNEIFVDVHSMPDLFSPANQEDKVEA